MTERIAADLNLLARFLGMRDVDRLTPEALQRRFGFRQADVMVLFGGSILAGGAVLAGAMSAGVARKYIIVGGEGHTTPALRRRVHAECPAIETAELPEAEVFDRWLRLNYGLSADHLETRSTNCGNNITHLLTLLRDERIPCSRIILCQDASMQRRMDAGLRKYAPDMTIVNYAAYSAELTAREGALCFADEIHGMWEMERYIPLLMGEIPRLRDDAQGYGPCGRGFIAHCDIPADVEAAFMRLQEDFSDGVRPADPRYAGN